MIIHCTYFSYEVLNGTSAFLLFLQASPSYSVTTVNGDMEILQSCKTGEAVLKVHKFTVK